MREECSLLSLPHDMSPLSSCVGDSVSVSPRGRHSSESRKKKYNLPAGIMVPHCDDALLPVAVISLPPVPLTS